MILIINGVCGTGKTTVASKLSKDYNMIHLRVDDVFNLIFDAKICKKHIDVTDNNVIDLVKNFKKHGFNNIIIDNVYEDRRHLNKIITRLRKYENNIVVIKLRCNLKENIERNLLRPDEDIMPEERVRELYKILDEDDELGICIDTTGISIESTIKKIREILKERGDILWT